MNSIKSTQALAARAQPLIPCTSRSGMSWALVLVCLCEHRQAQSEFGHERLEKLLAQASKPTVLAVMQHCARQLQSAGGAGVCHTVHILRAIAALSPAARSSNELTQALPAANRAQLLRAAAKGLAPKAFLHQLPEAFGMASALQKVAEQETKRGNCHSSSANSSAAGYKRHRIAAKS